jgi:hypothetical protein
MTPAPARFTLRQLTERGLLKELATAFNGEGPATALLDEIDYPQPLRPEFGAFKGSEYFWRHVCGEVEAGRTTGGLEALLAAAARQFPHGHAFAPWRPPASAVSLAGGYLPPEPDCFGREAALAELLGTLLPAAPEARVPATPVGGLGGIGKSTLVQKALWDQRVRQRYQDRRYFVRLDGATSRPAVVAAVAGAVGLPLRENLEARLLDLLGQGGPRLLALDNAETPLQADDRTDTEELLRHLAAVPALALVATLRSVRPLGAGWRQPIRLHRLESAAARQTFLAGTSGKFADDPALDDLLEELEGWPLALTLLAHQAGACEELWELADAWRRKRAALLTKGVKKKDADLGASIELSLNCPLLTADARRLLSLLGLLPDGVRVADLAELLPPDGADAARSLRQVGGLTFDERQRTRVLAPVREYLAANHPAQAEDQERAIGFFCQVAAKQGDRVGRVVRRRVSASRPRRVT